MAGINNSEILLNSFLKSAQNIITHFDKDKNSRNKYLKDLEKIVTNNCIHDEKIIKLTSIVRDVTSQADENTDSVMQMFNDRKGELKDYKPDVTLNANFKEYQRQIKEIVDDADGVAKPTVNDDDIEMTSDDVNVIDPFTKMRMTDPVTNKICGHVYERGSITTILQMNKNTRCPVVGCKNKNPVLMENIVSDIVMRKYLYDNPA